jgi:hypothetical protein
LKEIFGGSVVESASEEAGERPRWLVDFELRDEVKEQAKKADPYYEWMNPCDIWMIGKPADRACWQYLDRMIATRERNSKAVVNLYAATLLPPPFNLPVLMLAIFEWCSKGFKSRRST